MEKEFSFITLSYDHERYIIDHLESIKVLIQKYGKDRCINYIFADDASMDGTVHVVKKWLEKNRSLFCSVKIIEHETNVGIVKNLMDAIGICETDNYKFLGGDDKYGTSNIFKLVDDAGDSLWITPTIPFGTFSKKQINAADRNFSLLEYANSKGKVKQLMGIKNIFHAPGVFIPGKYLKEKQFVKYIREFHYIEDYPMWHYLLYEKNVDIVISRQPYIYYRYGSGVSTKKKEDSFSPYIEERKRIFNRFQLKMYLYPKIINPYAYYIFFLQCIIWLKYHVFSKKTQKNSAILEERE